MIVIGVDPGLATTGIGILESVGNKINVLGYGVIKTQAKTELPQRLKKIYDELSGLIEKYKPDVVVHEKVFFCNNAKTAILIGEAIGVIKLACINLNLNVAEYTPLQVKQAIVGYGFATKDQVGKMIQIVLGLKEIPKPDDAADALAIAFAYINLNKFTDTGKRK